MPVLRNLLGNQPVPAGTVRVPFPDREDAYLFVTPLYGNGKADPHWFTQLAKADRMYDGKDWRTVGHGSE